jgi:two-component system phosphate regulon sensor histidine kinase PhoR
MALTITGIVAFQASWMQKNYAEEKRLFTIHTNLLFRETILRLEASRLHLDTSLTISVQGSPGMENMTKMIRDRVQRDSSGKGHSRKNIFVSMNHVEAFLESDSPHRLLTPDFRVMDFVTGVDSLTVPLTVGEISACYRQSLDKEGVHLPFRVIAVPAARHRKDSAALDFPLSDPDVSRIMTGMGNSMAYELEFDHLSWWLARRLVAQTVFSCVLVGFTVGSFLLLYRNWQQQRKLTLLKNDFISNITHELKTPIATLSVAVEALKNFNALKDPVRTREYLDISSNELQRLSLLVDKVLKLSLFEREEIELKNDHFDLKALVEEVTASMRLQFEKCRAILTLDAPEADFYMRADKLHITSVIFNLLDNALKYSVQDPSIQVRLEAGQEQLLLSVTDNGMGIPAAYKERIFEKFFRVPTGDRHNVKGYGLGLSYASYVLQRHGGEISVESQEGTGSRFTVKIPRDHV